MSSPNTTTTPVTIHIHRIGDGSNSETGAIRNKRAGRGFASIGRRDSIAGGRARIFSGLVAKGMLLSRLRHEGASNSILSPTVGNRNVSEEPRLPG